MIAQTVTDPRFNVLLVEESGFNLFLTFYLARDRDYVVTTSLLSERQLADSKFDVLTAERDQMYYRCLEAPP